MEKRDIFLIIISVLLMLLLLGCNNNNIETKKINYIEGKLSNVLNLSGNYKCEFPEEKGVLNDKTYYVKHTAYVLNKSYKEEIISSEGTYYHLNIRLNDGGLCIFGWGKNQEDKTISKMCASPSKPDPERGIKDGLPHTLEEDQNVKCVPYNGNIDLNPPKDMKIFDLSNKSFG